MGRHNAALFPKVRGICVRRPVSRLHRRGVVFDLPSMDSSSERRAKKRVEKPVPTSSGGPDLKRYHGWSRTQL